MIALNPEAPAFVPAVRLPSSGKADLQPTAGVWKPKRRSESQEEVISEEALAELEAADEWVQLMVELNDMENEHLIASALSYAPAAAQVLEEEAEKAASRRKPHYKSR